MALAAQRRRRSPEELLELSPADGLVAGTGTVNAGLFGEQAARCLAIAYDYTVFAGTQGVMNHKKTDRMLALAEQWRLPVVLFAEGGGGRPGDTDFVGVAGLDCHTFVGMARLSGLVPTVGVVSGRCFAGNAALLGCCDVIIATQNATIGMAGPYYFVPAMFIGAKDAGLEATPEALSGKYVGVQRGSTMSNYVKATFPGGSITGAPKIRAMEIIDELEPTQRNIYTGSIGYIGFNGDLDLNIVIRTIVCKDGKGYFQVGGGIVWDSDNESEYQETFDKGRALVDALKRY